MHGGKGPDLLGLCEVENRQLVEALVGKLGPLGRDYRIVHKDSPSDRGIDCVLIYDAGVVELKDSRFHHVDVDPEKTRDIVEARFEGGGETLFVFVNHWPSRNNSEAQRIEAAGTLRGRLDEILGADGDADIVVVGDLNDHPDDASLKATLKAAGSPADLPAGALFNSMSPIQAEPGRGTYVFDNRWEVIDHVILSRGLLDDDGFRWKAGSTGPLILLDSQLFDPPGADTIARPNTSYSGTTFHADGFSDHLPVACILRR